MSGSEVGFVGDNFSIYHYDILKKNLGAMPCRMYQVRLFIDALCLIKTMSLNVLLRGVMIYICPQSGQVRVSPASFGSQSWVGFDRDRCYIATNVAPMFSSHQLSHSLHFTQ